MDLAEQVDYKTGFHDVSEVNVVHSPEPLYRDLDSPKEYPFHALGYTLRPIAELMHQTIQAPDAISGNSVIAAATLTIQLHVDVEIESNRTFSSKRKTI